MKLVTVTGPKGLYTTSSMPPLSIRRIEPCELNHIGFWMAQGLKKYLDAYTGF